MTPYRLGLTGSIGMGKTTTAGFFAAAGVPVWDADAAVHALYGPGGAGVAAIAVLAPAAVVGDPAGGGFVDREGLRAAVATDRDLLPRIEAVVHPLVAAHRAAFLADHADADIVLFDIPLLFETGAEAAVDAVVVVSAAPEVQCARVLARPGMTEEMFAQILARQIPDAEKRRRADYVIATDAGLEAASAAVQAVLAQVRARKCEGDRRA